MHQVFFGNAFIDHIPHALAAGFWRKSKPAFPDRLHLFRYVYAESVNAKAGQGNADLFILEIGNHVIQKRSQAGIIRRAEGHQGNFFIAGIFHLFMGQFPQYFRTAFPYRTVHHARMAEPASPAAATEHFQHDPVMDDLPERHNRRSGKIHGIQVCHHPFCHSRRSIRIVRHN